MLTNKLATICEKVIYSQAGLASLINMFTKVTIGVPNAAEIPRNAVAPKEWAIFSSWDAEPGDERREYFICVNVLYPDQSPWGDVNRTKVNIQEGRKASQVATQMVGFPVGQAGTYTIRVWIEESQRLVVNPIELSVELEIDSVQQPQ